MGLRLQPRRKVLGQQPILDIEILQQGRDPGFGPRPAAGRPAAAARNGEKSADLGGCGVAATVGVLAGGNVAAVGLGQPSTPVQAANGPATGVLGLNVGGHQILGQHGAPAVDLAILSPTGAAGTAVTGT